MRGRSAIEENGMKIVFLLRGLYSYYRSTWLLCHLSRPGCGPTRRKLFRRTFAVYSNYMKPVSLTQAIELTEKYFDFLKKKFNPTWRNQIGMIYLGVDDDFSLQPRLWRDRETLIIDKLRTMLKKYKAKMQIIFIIGWIEQST